MCAGESVERGDISGATLDYDSRVARVYLEYQREDATMQAIFQAGRNDDRFVAVARSSTP